LVGYFADIRFEIPSHGRCQVPVDVAPGPPAPSCADAAVENSDGTYTDTVASGGTLILPDTTYNFIVNGVTTSVTVPSIKDETFNVIWQ